MSTTLSVRLPDRLHSADPEIELDAAIRALQA